MTLTGGGGHISGRISTKRAQLDSFWLNLWLAHVLGHIFGRIFTKIDSGDQSCSSPLRFLELDLTALVHPYCTFILNLLKNFSYIPTETISHRQPHLMAAIHVLIIDDNDEYFQSYAKQDLNGKFIVIMTSLIHDNVVLFGNEKLEETEQIVARYSHNKGHLRVHGRLHTGDRPFRCHYCNQEFTHVGNLIKQHIITYKGICLYV